MLSSSEGASSTSAAAAPAQTQVKENLKQEGLLTDQACCVPLLHFQVSWEKQLNPVHCLPSLAGTKQFINVFELLSLVQHLIYNRLKNMFKSEFYCLFCFQINFPKQKVRNREESISTSFSPMKQTKINLKEGSLTCCSPWGCKESDMTEWLNWTKLKSKKKNCKQLYFQINTVTRSNCQHI